MPYANRSDLMAFRKRNYAETKEDYYFRHVQNTYGLSKEAFHQLLADQDYRCKLCGDQFPILTGSRLLHVDHCHETQTVRGLLCKTCNVGLGMLGDNEEGLLKALSYVKGELA